MQRTSKRARIIAGKKGLTTLRFRQKPKGTMYYFNPNAVRSRSLSYFGLKNVEWLRAREFVRDSWNKEPLHGGSGAIVWGKVKFAGFPKPKIVAIKGYFVESTPDFKRHLEQVVERLRKSKASHPKMAVLELPQNGRKVLYLLMEPFLANAGSVKISRFESTERVVNALNLHSRADQKVFRQVLNEAAELAKVGLIVPQSLGVPRDFIALGVPREMLLKIAHKQIDAFNKITLKNGSARVFAQDIDELQIVDGSPKKAWEQSTKNICEVVLQNNRNLQTVVESIAKEVARKHSF